MAAKMTSTDYDDPAVEEQWCDARRQEVIDYVARQGIQHGEVGEWPAWHVAPYVSIWAIESLNSPGWVGWWVICGDLPTDYISAEKIKHPREVARAIGERWSEVSAYMQRGEEHPDMSIGSAEDARELVPLLRDRAAILLDWAADDAVWPEP
jgi:hypothetical protein